MQQRAKISPAARKRAQELHVDVASLHGTGPEGAITVEDVERVGPSPQPSPAGVQGAEVSPGPSPAGAGEGAASMRAAIAAAMSRSKREIPHYYLATTVDVTPAIDWLAAHNAAVPVTERLLLPALLLKAVALSCRDRAGFSGFHRDGHYEQSPVVHVGVAVALRGGGLVAPAIMDTADKPLADADGRLPRPRDARASRATARQRTRRAHDHPDQPRRGVGGDRVAHHPAATGRDRRRRRRRRASLDRRRQRRAAPRADAVAGADHRVTDGRLGAQFLARIAARLATRTRCEDAMNREELARRVLEL